MLETHDDGGLAGALLRAFAWVMPDLAGFSSETSTFDALVEVLHWEGLDAWVLAREADELVVVSVRAAPERERQIASCFGRPPRFGGALAQGLLSAGTDGTRLRRGRWEGAQGAATCWVASEIRIHGQVEALLVVEGAGLGAGAAQVIERFAACAGAAVSRLRDVDRSVRALESYSRMQRTLVAEERQSALGEAAAVLAHEMRNPLASITNAVSLLQKGVESGSFLLSVIRQEAERLELLARDLLQLARPLEPRCREVDLLTLVHATVIRVQGSSGRNDVRFRVEPVDARVPASVDPSLLGLALENLLRNATQASPPSAEVRVLLSANAEGILVAVEDDGPGIDPAHHPRIFEPFFTTRPVGTGLGLPIVKRLVEAHGGRVRLASTAGRGARFEVLLNQGSSD